MSDFILKGNYKINPFILEKNESPFAGVGVAVITPFDHNNKIDKESIYKISDHLFCNGISYAVVQGTTGESSVLNNDEKEEANSIFLDAFKDRIPLILGVSSNDTRYLTQQISKTNLLGFEAIMSVCPYYNKPSQEGIFQHFKNICDVSPIPLLLYNVPGRTSCDMTNDTIIRLSEYSDKIIGVKEASGDVSRILELRKKLKRNFLIISGDDFTMIDAVRNGADGIISVAANAYPKYMHNAYLSLIWENDNKVPNDIKEIGTFESSTFLMNEFFNLIFEEGNPSGIKYALQCLNLCNDKVRLPLTTVSDDLKVRISHFIKKNNFNE